MGFKHNIVQILYILQSNTTGHAVLLIGKNHRVSIITRHQYFGQLTQFRPHASFASGNEGW